MTAFTGLITDEVIISLHARLAEADRDWRAVVVSREELRALLAERSALRSYLTASEAERYVRHVKEEIEDDGDHGGANHDEVLREYASAIEELRAARAQLKKLGVEP